MANKSDDDYWFTSTTKAFSFEDEASLQKPSNTNNFLNTSTASKISVYTEGNELTDEFQKCDIHIRSVISQQCLDKLLQNNIKNIAKENTGKIIERTLGNMLLNLPYTLENFKDLQSKTTLLDTSISIADGNVILTVVLFLASTLKKDIFYKLLSSRRIALLHYVNYLSTQLNTKELTDLLMSTGHTAKVGIKLFTVMVNNSTNDYEFKKRLEQLYNNHFSKSTCEKDRFILQCYIDLLEWQLKVQKDLKSTLGQSVNQSIAACYQRSPRGAYCIPENIFELQGVSERQFHWIFLDVKSSNQLWDLIQNFFIRKNWSGVSTYSKSSLSSENVAILLGERKAPDEVLQSFLEILDDSEQALNLALRYKCHKYVINHYHKQKDRTALLAYKSKFSPQSEYYFLIENKLLRLANNV